METRLGQNYEGIISGVTGWGLYVELPNTVEGLVHISTLMDDYYQFDEEAYCLVGEKTGHTYRLGQKVTVKVSQVDLSTKSIDFILKEENSCFNKYMDWRIKEWQEKGSRLIANNKKAYHDYFIEETYEAGIALHGTEVKSLRMGKCSIKESFVRIENEEVYIYGMHISPYEKGNIFNRDPLRVKKLLLHKSEIRKMKGKIAEKGYTLVPLKVYFNRSLVKVEIGLAKGKKLYDKRQDIAKKDQRREAERDFKVRNLY